MTETIENINKVEPVKRGRGRPRKEKPPKILKQRGRKVGTKMTVDMWHVVLKRIGTDDLDLGNFPSKQAVADKLGPLLNRKLERYHIDDILRGMSNTKRGDIIITKIL